MLGARIAQSVYQRATAWTDRISSKGKSSSPSRPDRLWDPPNLLSNVYRSAFPKREVVGDWSWSLTSD
jgi:hypothetical protein